MMTATQARDELSHLFDGGPMLAPAQDVDGEPNWGSVVVFKSITSDTFLEWLEREGNELQRWQFEPRPTPSYKTMRDDDDDDESGLDEWLVEPRVQSAPRARVVVYSAPTPVHEWTASAIINSIRAQVATHGCDAALERSLLQPASMVCLINDRLQCPDDALVPAQAMKDRAPTLVVEIAYMNESNGALQARLFRWMQVNSGVQVAIGIKVFSSTKRTAMLLRRGAMPQFVEFGVRTKQRGTLTFPLRALFASFPLPKSLVTKANAQIKIKLDDLAGVINRAQKVHASK